MFTLQTINKLWHTEEDIAPFCWALPLKRKVTSFNPNQIDYLTQVFRNGAISGHKQDPYSVSDKIKTGTITKDGETVLRFNDTELLTYRQIQSFFSRMKRNNEAKDLAELDEQK